MDITPMEYLAHTYGGFTNPWRSVVEGWSGEDAYTALLDRHLGEGAVVVEAGCGHGTEAVDVASRVARVVAFDAVPAFIDIAQRAATERNVRNVEFVVADCSPKRNNGRAVLPIADHAADAIVSRRGPTSWIADARRALKPDGVMIHLAYLQPPVPAWNHSLPESLRLVPDTETMPHVVYDRLAAAGIDLHSAWTFDVPERFTEPVELHHRLAWERRSPLPPFADVAGELEAVFAAAGTGGVVIRQRRFLWKAFA